MNANFIYSTNYNGAFRQIVDKINARKIDLNVRHLLIVPEQYTLLAEKLLYENSYGSFDVEVLSPSRLFYKMNIPTPLLSREGAIMLLRGMLPDITLSCFNKASFYRGFCEKLYDAINDFAANGVLPNDISSFPPKLADLKVIYAEYLARIEGRFVDGMGKLDLIAKNVETSEYLKNVHIYIANFDYVDKATRRVFDKLKEIALSYTECIVNVSVKSMKLSDKLKTEKFAGEGAPAVKEVAKRLRYYAYRGVKYEDMAVIVGNADSARIKRIFTEFGIPHFVAESSRLIDHPLSVLLIRLFECASKKKRESIIELSKNMYLNIDKREADRFENYIYENLVDYHDFDNPFGECEQVRKKINSLVDYAASLIKNIVDARSLGKAIADVFAYLGAEKLTEEQFGSSVTEKIDKLVSLMEQVGIRGNFDFVFSVFIEGLKSTKLSSLPYEGGVIVGSPLAFRGGRYKFIAIIGFDDGFLPQIYDDSSLIGDEEKACFTQMERIEEINLRYEAELAACLDSAEYALATFTQPSGMMEEVFKRAKTVDNRIMEAGCFKHATELLLTLVNRSRSGAENDPEFLNALFVATGSDDSLFIPKRVGVVDCGEKLFFPEGYTSVSQLQCYFECPMRHFADYGLRLKRRDKGEITPLDVGDLMHRIAELVIKRGGNLDDLDKIVEELTPRLGKLAQPAYADKLASIKEETREVLKIFLSHLGKGKFVSLGQEISFDAEFSGLKLHGKIDYADVFGNYIRLIDYKTGKADFELSDVYYGRKIQLPIYMAALCKRGYKKAAMFNFPLFSNYIKKQYEHRFSGFMLRDDKIIEAVDSTYEEGESEVFKLKSASGRMSTSRNLMTNEELDALVNYAVRVSDVAAAEIRSGFVAAYPHETACRYCDYKCLCAEKQVRKFAPVDKSSFEERENGVF